MSDKSFEGTCYIGVVGSETENGECHDSISNLAVRPGDSFPMFFRATKGYEARQSHINAFLETKHDFLFLVDSDMIFQQDALERLRDRKLPFVSGLYMRRRYNPMVPIWFENAEPGVLPLKIWTRTWETNKLYEIGASGWGCMLMHRDVILATRKILKGEPDIIEDDMDIYPYDLNTLFSALRHLDMAANESDTIASIEIRRYVAALRNEIRPLRGKKDNVGSDVRFPFFAKLAGYQLYGDSGVMCGHMLNYPLHPNDYNVSMNEDQIRSVTEQTVAEWQKETDAIAQILKDFAGGAA